MSFRTSGKSGYRLCGCAASQSDKRICEKTVKLHIVPSEMSRFFCIRIGGFFHVKRLAELTKLLKMDEKDRELLDGEPYEGDKQPDRKVAGLER